MTTGIHTSVDTYIGLSKPGDEQEWDDFIQAAPTGTLFHLTGWRRVVERALGHKSISLVARRNGRISGVLPISLVKNRLFGNCLVSMPLAVYGGVCASDQESYAGLLKAGQELAGEYNVRYLELRNAVEPYRVDLPERKLYVTFTQDLRPGPDKLMQALPRDTRYMVRKSLKGDLTWTGDITLREFYEIYAQSVHRLGTPVFSRSLFSAIQEEFPEHCRLYGVRKGSQAIAAVLCLYFKDRVMPYYGGSLAEFNRDAPNNFMYWNLMTQSCSEGYHWFDFGRSKQGTGAYHFKSSWSMQETALPYRYHLVKAREVPRISPVDQKFQLPVAAWKRMPYSWTKILGPALIRWIPSI